MEFAPTVQLTTPGVGKTAANGQEIRTAEQNVELISVGFLPIKAAHRVKVIKPAAPVVVEGDGKAANGEAVPYHAEGANKKKRGKKKKKRGRNEKAARGFYKAAQVLVDGKPICRRFASTGECGVEGRECRFSHDLAKYVQVKGADLGETCYVYDVRGFCQQGVTCRFAQAHTDADLKQQRKTVDTPYVETINIPPATYFREAKKNKFVYTESKVVQEKLTDWRKSFPDPYLKRGGRNVSDEARAEEDSRLHPAHMPASADRSTWSTKDWVFGDVTVDKKKAVLDWDGLTYLAPLTTVGNLPFRRLCVDLGVDITCGEMALAQPINQGRNAEWALFKRHPCEKIFGVQIAAKNVTDVTKTCELINKYCSVDFVDLNVGCPIDLICYQSMGSALMQRKNRLRDMTRAMALTLNCPATVKMRKGWSEDSINAHNLAPQLNALGAQYVGIHGRTRQQRYARSADWGYISAVQRNPERPCKIIGNGDVFTVADYNKATSRGIKTVMVARGALIKPWIFTEIKEQKDWDISSSERFQLLKDFTNYGLDHWGSDTRGVDTTRRFLLEWMSFLCRYVPIGLQSTPEKYAMNLRPERFQGRDDMETLLGSQFAGDWVKITEMLLGPVSGDYKFVPKHRANSYAAT